jgi:serine/threonine protein kinase
VVILDFISSKIINLINHVLVTPSFIIVEFFTACIIIALEFLHLNGMIHRDVKPENLVYDKQGYLHLTDLGVDRIWKPENLADTSGTPGYMGINIYIC